MKITKVPNSTSWLVSIEPNELMLTATKAYPYGGYIGTINARGTLRVYTPAVGRPRDWKKLVTYKLEDARQKLFESGELINKKAIKARKDEKRTGSFRVEIMTPSGRGRPLISSRFHSMPPAMKWADEQLKGLKLAAGSRAEFFRTLPEGSTYKGVGSPWTEPFHVHEINEYGHIHMGALRKDRPASWGPSRSPERGGSWAVAYPAKAGGKRGRVVYFASKIKAVKEAGRFSKAHPNSGYVDVMHNGITVMDFIGGASARGKGGARDPIKKASQNEMFYGAHRKMTERMKTFNDIMKGPNPLSQDEIRKLIAKRPAEYAFMRAWLKSNRDPATPKFFGKERTLSEIRARIRWEKAAAQMARRSGVVGAEILGQMHDKTRRAYEDLLLRRGKIAERAKRRDPGYRTVGPSILSTFGKGRLRREIGVIGNAMWRLPSPSPFVIYWNGPGARLLFGTNKPGSQLSPVAHPSADGNYNSLKEAQAAVTRFWKSES
jgi:hypothetical protein